LITLKNVTKNYGNLKAIDNVSFEIAEGEIVGLLGPNGAGKSTTMNMITGYIESTNGDIFINGYDIKKQPTKAKSNIGYMPESTPLYMDLTVKEFIKYMAELKGIDKTIKIENINKTINKTGLSNVQNKLIKNLSRGYKQRVSLAGTLVGDPKILILDEPTVGLDPKQITEIRSLIKSLGKKHTIIISSHILSEISQLCEKVIIINNGKIIAKDSPKNLENKVANDNCLLITIEDPNKKIDSIIKKFTDIKQFKFIKDNNDGTKQYMAFPEDNKDIRKTIFEKFAKEGITIFELKKVEATLEDAFIKLINKNSSNIDNNNINKDIKKGGN